MGREGSMEATEEDKLRKLYSYIISYGFTSQNAWFLLDYEDDDPTLTFDEDEENFTI